MENIRKENRKMIFKTIKNKGKLYRASSIGHQASSIEYPASGTKRM
jgi:hypothetical protein